MPRLVFALKGSVASLILLSATIVDAAPKIPAPRARRIPAQANNPKRIPRQALDPAVSQVLRRWQSADSQIDRFDAKFDYTRYDAALEAEYVGTGLISVDRQGRGIYKFNPTAIGRGQRGRRYPLQSTKHESWFWTENSVIWVDNLAKQYGEFLIPVSDRNRFTLMFGPDRPPPPAIPEDVTSTIGLRLVRQFELPPPPPMPEDVTPLGFFKLLAVRLQPFPAAHPLIHWISADADAGPLTEQFHISIRDQSEAKVVLRLRPKLAADQARFKEVLLMLSCKDYRLRAVKFVEDSARETVYSLRDVRINQRPSTPFGELKRPELNGYARQNPPLK